MTWTYDATDISTDLAKVRLAIGDTNTNDQQLTDEEINYRLTENGNPTLAAAACAEDIAAKIARDKDRSAVGMTSNLQSIYDRYTQLAKTLRSKAQLLGEVDVGGVSVDRKDTIESNTDLISHFATRNRFTNYG